LAQLSDRFNPVDGPLDPLDHIELLTDIIVSGLRIAQPDAAARANGHSHAPRTKRRT
jgi:hypothetical protein